MTSPTGRRRLTRLQQRIVGSWGRAVACAIRLGDDAAAYRLTRAFVRRCRELGLLNEGV